ncbi:hypothetical protein CC79DRAFT_1359949 [Sarocladium strictum]
MRFSAAVVFAATLLSGFGQAQPVDDIEIAKVRSFSFEDRSVAGATVSPAHELAVRTTTDLEPSNWLLQKRASSRWSKGRISCPGPFKKSRTSGFRTAIKKLRKRKGKPTLPGKGDYATCDIICYPDGTQISWCNKSKKRKTLSSWSSVAEGIEALLNQPTCTKKTNGVMMTGGAIYHPTNWYVFAGKCWPDK